MVQSLRTASQRLSYSMPYWGGFGHVCQGGVALIFLHHASLQVATMQVYFMFGPLTAFSLYPPGSALLGGAVVQR